MLLHGDTSMIPKFSNSQILKFSNYDPLFVISINQSINEKEIANIYKIEGMFG